MPELPDVEVLKRYFDSTALRQEIAGVSVEDDQVLKEISPADLRAGLQGAAFRATDRHGKYLFAELEGAGWLVLHFGMTGDLKYYQIPEKQSEYDLVSFDFKNGYHLAYIMTRKLGEVRLIDDVESFIKRKDLGPDVWGLDYEDFRQALEGRSGMIKSTLMNQSILAGIGNVYSDEILFQAGVYPRKPVNELDEDILEEVYRCMNAVLETSVEHKAVPDRFPDTYLTPLRGEEGAQCPRCSGSIERIEVSGRSGYYCPSCQEA